MLPYQELRRVKHELVRATMEAFFHFKIEWANRTVIYVRQTLNMILPLDLKHDSAPRPWSKPINIWKPTELCRNIL